MKAKSSGPIRTAVRREKAEQYMLIALLAFGGTVILTRLFLELTGYPQIGNAELHIAHVVWGGLFLFVATLLPLIFANHWAMVWSAATGGIGFGLFIDELGKFLTQTNDYFYPPAAPIIYTLFLITVLVYIHIRRPRETSDREELYQVLHELTEFLDRDLDATELAAIKRRLERIQAGSDNPQLTGLAAALQEFITSESVEVVPENRVRLDVRIRDWIREVEKLMTRERSRVILEVGLGGVGIYSIIKLVTLGVFISAVFKGLDILPMVDPADFEIANEPLWFMIRLTVQGLVGFLSMLAAIMLFWKRDQTAVKLAILGLTISLAVVDILIFYLDQFSASIGAILEFIVLLLVVEYRQRFLITPRTPLDQPVKI